MGLILAAVIALVAGTSGVMAEPCRTRAAACDPGRCSWSDPVSWDDCGAGRFPQARSDTVQVEPGATVVYDRNDFAVGTIIVYGTVRFDESSSGRDALGFRSLVLSAGPSADLILRGDAVLQLRRGERIRFDTTDPPGEIAVRARALLDVQGHVHQTTIASIVDEAAAPENCGPGLQGGSRFWKITPSDGGPFSSRAQKGRRIVFLGGRAPARHFEIWSFPG